MVSRLALLALAALSLAGCGGSNRYGTGNPISGYTDCDVFAAEGSDLCSSVYDSQSARRNPPTTAAAPR